MTQTAYVGPGEPCPRDLELLEEGEIRRQMVMPLRPERVLNPRLRDGSGPCCRDCASADALMTYIGGMDFTAARVAVGNDRMEALLLPDMHQGLVSDGLALPSAPGDWERHQDWLKEHEIWPTPDDEADFE